jgi:adenine-specific DNA-methyltransferase
MAYLKNWSARSYNKIELKVPDLLNQSQYGKSMAYKMNALDASKEIIADAAYLDPPYNQHSYLGNYHVWETLVLWDRPDIYGVACKRLDTKAKKSNFNFKNNAKIEMAQVINNLNCNSLIISFNNEGFISSEEMITMLKGYKEVKIYEYDYKRYVGAQIGIYNPSGELSGEISHLRNKEYIFVATGRNKLNG